MYRLFEVYGIESEYILVDKENLEIKPIAEKIIKHFNHNKITSEVNLNKHISISNELVRNVIELKTALPKETLLLDNVFHQAILILNTFLDKFNVILMPTGMHPLLNPRKEIYIWKYTNRKIYNVYNEIFNCKGHGWSNLQSVHINLPFQGDKEFFLLHNAIRIVLPIIPALSASSPFVEGKEFFLDSRLYYYERNQKKIPLITGKVIPEYITTIEEYKEKILNKMYEKISKYDTKKILQNEWLNSRGAIPRFERNAIEIRLMDIQESPIMDFTLINLFVEMIKYLVYNHFNKEFDLYKLYDIYKDSLQKGTNTILPKEYLKIWNIRKNQQNVKEFINEILTKISYPKTYLKHLEFLLNEGNLSERILKFFKKNKLQINQDNIIKVYKKIIYNLSENSFFNDL